jgi:hypothetical protein
MSVDPNSSISPSRPALEAPVQEAPQTAPLATDTTGNLQARQISRLGTLDWLLISPITITAHAIKLFVMNTLDVVTGNTIYRQCGVSRIKGSLYSAVVVLSIAPSILVSLANRIIAVVNPETQPILKTLDFSSHFSETRFLYFQTAAIKSNLANSLLKATT